MNNQQKAVTGFTLIELLVVVLIIGILAAVAVPQYQKAVYKSRAAEALSVLSSIRQAQEVYYLANNEYTDDLAKLDVSISAEKASNSWLGRDAQHPTSYIYSCTSAGICAAASADLNMPIFQWRFQHYQSNSEYDAVLTNSLVCVTLGAAAGALASTDMATSICKSLTSSNPIPVNGHQFYGLNIN